MADALMLLGPTASGKSSLSLKLARELPIEVISIDSALVYRGMDIGSAKPTPEERSTCPHHLLDIREIDEPYSAAEFVEDCTRIVGEVRKRGNIPLIVGGTMLYAKALREGINDMPPTDEAVRAEVAAEGAARGWPAMRGLLAEFDPKTAARLSPNDKQRIGRAIEVYRISGRPLSSFHEEAGSEPPLDLDVVGLMPGDRKRLHEDIRARFNMMLDAGFLDEVGNLMKSPRFHEDSPAMRSVGYRQAIMHLKGEVGFEQFVEMGVAATRQLAKRQMTWLRGMIGVMLVDPCVEDALEVVRNRCLSFGK